MGSFEQSSITSFVEENVIVVFDEGLDKTKAGEPARGKDEAGGVQELSDLVLQLSKIPTCNLKYLVAPKARGLPAELTPNSLAAYMPASTVKG